MPSPQLALDLPGPAAVQAEPLSGQALRDQALARLEQARRAWIGRARFAAFFLVGQRGEVSADDIHEHCPVPADMDPRVMGAVFGRGNFRVLRYQPSRRAINHARFIPVWGAK